MYFATKLKEFLVRRCYSTTEKIEEVSLKKLAQIFFNKILLLSDFSWCIFYKKKNFMDNLIQNIHLMNASHLPVL